MNRSFCLTALVLLPLTAAPAFADCSPNSPGDGETVTCSGTDSDGFSRNREDLTINVLSDATVETVGDVDAIRVRGDDNTVNNDGTIRNTADADGAIGDAVDGRDGLTVTNTGSIIASNKGVDTDNGDGLTLANSASILATDKAVRTRDDARITNSGSIVSEADEGIETRDDALIENSGMVLGFDDAIQVGERATILNSGRIENTGSETNGGLDDPQDAIDIDSGTITNTETGIIRSTLDAAIDFDISTTTSTIINRGLISGKFGILVETGAEANTAAQIVDNFGQIVGTSGVAMVLGEGDDVLSLYGGSALTGAVDMGEDNDTLNLFDDLAGLIADGSVLDGGEGVDLVDFVNLTIADVARAVFDGSVFRMRLITPETSYSVALRNWENYRFGNETYDRAQITAVAPVPVPAAGLLMLAGLGGLALLRRRA